MSELLKVCNLSVNIDDLEILKELNFTIKPGETHVLMGPNGAGKSTLGHALMGNPAYTVSGGELYFEGENLHETSVDYRAKKGMFLSFQNPLEVPGISLEAFLRNATRGITGKPLKIMQFKKQLKEACEILQMDESYLSRDLNVGFSGGEKKKSEILQLLMLNPKLAILDETDSGLDVDAVKSVGKGIQAFQKNPENSLLIITHSTRILESLKVDYTHIMVKGRLVETGDGSLVEEINKNGFARFEKGV